MPKGLRSRALQRFFLPFFFLIFLFYARTAAMLVKTKEIFVVVGATALAVWAWCRWQRLSHKDIRVLIHDGAASQAPCAPEDEDQALAASPKAPAVALPPPDPLSDEEFPTRVKGAALAGWSTSSKVSGSPQSKSRQAWQQRQQRGELRDEPPDSASSTLPAPAMAPTPAPAFTAATPVVDSGKVAALVALAGKKKQSGNDALKDGVCVDCSVLCVGCSVSLVMCLLCQPSHKSIPSDPEDPLKASKNHNPGEYQT